jgi:hypothetical protein
MRTVLALVLLAALAAFTQCAVAQEPMELLQGDPAREELPSRTLRHVTPGTPLDRLERREESDLGGGVLIAHHPPGLLYTAGPTDWCAAGPRITSCEQQNCRIDDRSNAVVWYVLAAWPEGDKVWCGVEFGLGDYDPSSLGWVAHGACPSNALTLPDGAWPGPHSGIAIATTKPSWTGNYQPVYFFASYAYRSATLPLIANPKTGRADFVNCAIPGSMYDAVCLGSMGLLTPGTPCCPPAVVAKVCCVDETCRLMLEEECADLGGAWHPGRGTCDGSPCERPHACCVDGDCQLVDRRACGCMDGVWHPEWDTCTPKTCAE